jgi:L-arabinokinase
MSLADVNHFIALIREEQRSFFTANAPILITRAPGRLDVMGGISDYSGSLVLEMPIAETTLAAIQLRDEPVIQVMSLGGDRVGRAAVFTLPLSDFLRQNEPVTYETTAAIFRADPEHQWAAYIAGAFLVLMREKGSRFQQGARLLLTSTVPEGKGVSSSAAVEVAAMQAIAAAYQLDIRPRELALLCQKVENHVAGAPCGIMDQMTVVAGQPNQLLALLCQPAEIQGMIAIPDELAFWGVDSGIRHAVSGADYGSVRAGAFMGYKILQSIAGRDWGGYLANLGPAEFEQEYRAHLPERMAGADFLREYGPIPDGVTSVSPQQSYAICQPTLHPIYEHFRVQTFARLLAGDALLNAPLLGELMFQSHASYSACGLGSGGTDLLVEMAREAGAQQGVYGAKITGGGSGGTVVVLARTGAEAAVQAIAAKYADQTGHTPHIFAGSSPGAAQFGYQRLWL